MSGHYTYDLKATANGKVVTRQITIASGTDNTFDLRPDFRPARPAAHNPVMRRPIDPHDRIHIESPEPAKPPRIAPNYLGTEYDRHVAVQALRLTRRIVSAPALSAFQPEEVAPGAQFQSDDELAAAAGRVGTTIFHPVGTCKMGTPDDSLAVVDSELRVFGVEGLRVADASVMPTITSGNTNSPTLMIAERAAELILQSSRGFDGSNP